MTTTTTTRLHLSRNGRTTECGQNFRHAGGLRDTPHPHNLGIYRDAPCVSCFEARATTGDDFARACLLALSA